MFNAPLNTGQIMAIRRSTGLPVLILLGVLGYTAFAAFLTVQAPPQRLAEWLHVAGIFSVSAAVIALLVWFLRRVPRVALTLGPDGFRYYRLGAEPVPWPAVEKVSLLSMKSLSRLDVSYRRGEAGLVTCTIRLSELAISAHAAGRAFAAYRAAHG